MEKTNVIQKAFYRSAAYLKRHSPTILTFVGAAGVVATVIMSARATPKAMKLLEEAEAQKGEELDKLETIRTAAPAYIPVAAIGISSLICLFGANVLNQRNQASLTAAYAMLNESYSRYRGAANTVFGDDADSKIKAEVAKETYISADGCAIYDASHDDGCEECLFYDEISDRYFQSTMASVLNAQYHLNRNFTLRGYVSLNEFYEFLGIEKVVCGEGIGWGQDLLEDGIFWIDFDNRYVKYDDGLECYIVSALFEPTADYLEG